MSIITSSNIQHQMQKDNPVKVLCVFAVNVYYSTVVLWGGVIVKCIIINI